jgi:hypothetical protein
MIVLKMNKDIYFHGLINILTWVWDVDVLDQHAIAKTGCHFGNRELFGVVQVRT